MKPRDGEPLERGSWQWAVRVAELSTWGTVLVIAFVVHIADLPSTNYRWIIGVLVGASIWFLVLFRILVPRFGNEPWLAWSSLVVDLTFASAAFGLLHDTVRSAQLLFVPVIVGTGLLGSLTTAIPAAVLAVGGYWLISDLTGSPPGTVEGSFNSGLFLLSGSVAGLLARELRLHYRGEQKEHRLATAVRHRLMAVLDAVGEAIIFSDRQGTVRLVNQRAGEIFDVDPDEHLGLPVVQLLRTLAIQTEDPEGFMELFQDLRDDPESELRLSVEQLLPQRRQLLLYSAPAFDEKGGLVGRIDVYTDITESVRRAAEIQELYEQARKTAESYQRSLLPESVPSLPRLNFVAHYVAAAGRKAVCGDFYDFLTMPDGRVGVLLGDVCGIGPAAVNDAALTRYTLRSFASEEPDPGRLLARINAHMLELQPSERFVRLFFAVLDPERAVIEYANAGHVPPVVHRYKSGEVEWLGEGGVALSVEEEAEYKVGRVELDPGDMLVLYTDGVTEADRKGRPLGQGKFSDLVKEYGVGTPGELLQAIRRHVDKWVGEAELRDDLAMLVCQVVPDTAIGEPVRELVLPNEPVRLREIRRFVSGFLADLRVPVEVSSEIMLAVGEATGNACKHGRREEGRNEIRVRCVLMGPNIVVTVADEGPGFEPARAEARLPDRFASGGRGLFLMRQMMDAVDFDSSRKGTTVTLIRWVFGAPKA